MQSNDTGVNNFNTAGLIDAGRSLLLVIDFQQRLMPAIHDGAAVLRNAVILAQGAKMLAIPALATEQYPRGLGHTAPELAALCPESVEKTTFWLLWHARFWHCPGALVALQRTHAAGVRLRSACLRAANGAPVAGSGR